MELQLKISGEHYEQLKGHLLKDEKEAVAIALCGRHIDREYQSLLVHEILPIPHEECMLREIDFIQWSTKRIEPFLRRINRSDLAILKVHSHPTGYRNFSITDDSSDLDLFSSVFGWAISENAHASAIMLPGGEIFGRFVFADMQFKPISKISIIGDQVIQFKNTKKGWSSPDFALRTIQAFGDYTCQTVKSLKIAVIGCSGTGSPVIEQLVRLGVGELLLIDPDFIEFKNLNRIINSRYEDAKGKRPKVEVIADAISGIGLGTTVKYFQNNLFDEIDVLKAIVKCDVVFGCMDSIDGRFLLSQLCAFYLLPYFDLGVKLEANGIGGINQIVATAHYIQPGKSSLITRGMFDMEDVRAASQYRKCPEEFLELKKNAYIKNVNVNSPAVISINMMVAAHSINDFLNRIHPFKVETPDKYASSTIDITEGYILNTREDDYLVDSYLKKKTGRGDVIPFVELPELS